MDNLTASQKRVSDLVRLLCGRDASEEEISAAARPQFNFGHFRFQILVGDECANRWPGVIKAFGRFAEKQRETAGSTHKIAHDLSVVRRELDRAQATIDGLQAQILAMLGVVDNIAQVSGSIREVENKILGLGSITSSIQDRLASYLANERE
jgi:hypothetical protein